MDTKDQLVEEVVSFHGHLCPGLSIGIRMAQRALDILGSQRSEDEELLAVVEMDNCAVDGIQYLTGATFGKGNLIFRDYGKVAATFYRRGSESALRLCLKPEARETPEFQAAKEGPDAKKRVTDLILAMPAAELFNEQTVSPPDIPTATIYDSIVCAQCGEAAMETRMVEIEGRMLCIPCRNNR